MLIGKVLTDFFFISLSVPICVHPCPICRPNFNSADPAPGSTHNDTLRSLVQALWEMGARDITLADRSGMADTNQVMRQKGIFQMGEEPGFSIIVLDELGENGWVHVRPRGSHWRDGFLFARPCLDAECVVQNGTQINTEKHRFLFYFFICANLCASVSYRRPLHPLAEELGGPGATARLPVHGGVAQFPPSAA